jgi:diaminohydroxyphosphoribosylaminopyrimidine deaminase / 5-amino-6-(5-phosphoribosylamino)uracil reductase
MALALSLARRGLGSTWPNPAVGCVLVNAGRIVGRGWTQPGGRPHAERVALAQAGDLARGATAYVTLEPCSHHGKTSPCAEALVAAGISRVVSAQTDPDPRVSGRGHALLRAAGITVDEGVLEAEARALQIGFLLRVTEGRPMLTLKLATSFDGRIATESGESQWITGPDARRLVHAQRARHDAVMVGGGTVRADDPLLTVRGLGMSQQPVRVVASRGLDLPRGAMAASLAQAPLWLLHGASASAEARGWWQDQGAQLMEVAETAAGLSAPEMLQALGQAGLTRVFCEGGGQLAAALLDADLVDELVGFTAGLALGGAGRAAVAPMQARSLADYPRFDLKSESRIGAELLHHWIRRR